MPLQQRRLTDLFILGRELTLDDGYTEDGPDGEVIEFAPVTVWLQKLNPIEQAEASRHADATRARYLAMKSQPDSDEYQQQVNAVLTLGEDPRELAAFVLGDERQKAKVAVNARLSSEPEWEEDNLLQGLYDSWNTGGLKERWVEDQEDPEASRVFELLNKFASQVEEGIEAEMEPYLDAKLSLPIEELRHLTVERMIELDAGQQWMDEYYRWEMYFCVRDPVNRKKRYFNSRAEVDELTKDVYLALRDAFMKLEVEVHEGKSSPGPRLSSPSSEPPAEVVTEQDSAQKVATP